MGAGADAFAAWSGWLAAFAAWSDCAAPMAATAANMHARTTAVDRVIGLRPPSTDGRFYCCPAALQAGITRNRTRKSTRAARPGSAAGAPPGPVAPRARGRLPDRVDPLTLPARLTAPLPSYVSLQSASVPAWHDLAGAGRHVCRLAGPRPAIQHARVESSTAADASATAMRTRGDGATMASPEKALVDFLYLAPARSMLFRALPEVESSRVQRRRPGHR